MPDGSLPTLSTWPQVASAVAQGVADCVALSQHRLTELVRSLVAAEPKLRSNLQRSDKSAQYLLEAFRRRWKEGLSIPQNSAMPARQLDTLTADFERAASRLDGQSLGFLNSTRRQRLISERDAMQQLLSRKVPSEIQLLQQGHDQFMKELPQLLDQATPGEAEGLAELLDLVPPGIAPLPGVGASVRPGVGPLVVQVATLVQDHAILHLPDTASNGNADRDFVTVNLPPLRLPAVIDLDEAGGVVVDTVQRANSILLRLLAVLPAGQLRISIFDPARLGESASFLFGLGEAATDIIGTKVKTSERELNELLTETEDHLTFVTQKYLQGTYDSLTAYNAAAGDVAEPYRVLVLYDFPTGVRRADSSQDHDLLARLRRMIDVGRRCGVYTVIVAPELAASGVFPTATDHEFAALKRPNAVADQRQLSSLFAAVSQLPWVATNRVVSPFLARLAGAEGLPLVTETIDTFRHPKVGIIDAVRQGRGYIVKAGAAAWSVEDEEPPAQGTVEAVMALVQRGLAAVEDVRVDARTVARLARARLDRQVAVGTRVPELLPDPDDETTWWSGSTLEAVTTSFARVGAKDVGEFRLDSESLSHALIGGRPGSGKSVLLHALITGLTRTYAPAELDLYLIDFKEGVEFTAYARGALPHARVVAIDSDREFGLSILRSLDAELNRRGAAFREAGGKNVSLAEFRTRTSQTMSRIVAVIDEFQVLFDRDDAISGEAAVVLERLVRQGRAFGVHLVLASQSLSGVAGLGRHVLGLIPVRLVLASGDADSRLLLSEENPDAQLLSRAGEGILNTAAGLREANQRFQAVFTSVEEREDLIARLRRRADIEGWSRRPTVFEGDTAVDVQQALADGVPALRSTSVSLNLPVGMPMTLDGAVCAEFRREPGANLLAVTSDERAAHIIGLGCLAAKQFGVEVSIVDNYGVDSPLETLLGQPTLQWDGLSVLRRRGTDQLLQSLVELVIERQDLQDFKSGARLLVLAGLHRARDFDANYGGDMMTQLESLLRDGPEVGVHVIATLDRPASIGRRLTHEATREFGLRLLSRCNATESYDLIGSDIAGDLREHQLVVDDHDRAVTSRVRAINLSSEFLR